MEKQKKTFGLSYLLVCEVIGVLGPFNTFNGISTLEVRAKLNANPIVFQSFDVVVFCF